jgi:ribonuclease HI
MLLDPHAIHIYADGSCYENPGGDSGCAAIVHYPDNLNLADELIVDFGCSESSNNRMELMACVKSLEWIREHRPWPEVERVQVVTDSAYITENVNYRAPSWKKNGWRNRHGQPIANDDLWDNLLKARAKVGIRVDFVWQPGKRSLIAKQVDKAAKSAANRGGLDDDVGYRPGGVSRSMVRDSSAAERFPAGGQVAVIRPYVKKIMHKGEHRLSFNVFDEETQTYSGKFFAFADKRLASELHLGNGHKVRFNSEPNYPMIMSRIDAVLLPKPARKRASSKKSAQ